MKARTKGLAIAAAILSWLAAPVVQASPALTPLPGAQSLDGLLQQFDEGAPTAAGSVSLDAWVEEGPNGGREVVIVLAPAGKAKLIADPGITVTPIQRAGVEWQLPLPHRHVDSQIDYFAHPPAVRLPFIASDGLPLELHVEYAWCFVDYQCFFGEETLRVANRIE